MKANFLFPNVFKKIGWVIFIPTFLITIYFTRSDGMFMDNSMNIETAHNEANKHIDKSFPEVKVFALWADNPLQDTVFLGRVYTDITDEVLSIFLIVSALMIGFSRQKIEDEYISKIRIESLVWATYVNYSVIIFSILFFYGVAFYWVLVLNTITVLLFFIIRFNWAIAKFNKTVLA